LSVAKVSAISEPAFDRLFYRAEGATDPTEATELWKQVQSEQWNTGGYIVWAFNHSTDAVLPAPRRTRE
jgi:ABC-type transport system substrate-binding protein